MDDLFVVGDSFARASVHERVHPASEIIAALAGDTAFDRPVRLTAGLGITRATWDEIRAVAERHESVRVGSGPPRPADRRLVNKRYDSNVLIGDPLRLDEDCFGADLCITDDSEMIRDQPADKQHVPGFALAEAAAQLIRWAVKVRFPVPPGKPPRYAVMHGMRCRFERFTFPLPARLLARFDVADETASERIPVDAVVDIEQGGRTVSSCEFGFHAFHPEHIFAIEHAQATKLLNDGALVTP